MPCIVREDSIGEPQAVATSIEEIEEQSDSENTGKRSDNIWNALSKKGMWEVFTVPWHISQSLFEKL